jgi:hypothetical protein
MKKNILAENMRRFGTKNLLEQTSWYDMINPIDGDVVTIQGSLTPAARKLQRGDQEGFIDLNGMGYSSKLLVGSYTSKDAIRLANENKADLPSRKQALELADKIEKTNAPNPGVIWIDQSKGVSDTSKLNQNMRVILFDLRSKSDVVGTNLADAVFLLYRR